MVDEATLKLARQMLGYTDAQWESWKKNPRNLRVLENLESFQTHKLVAEVVSAPTAAPRATRWATASSSRATEPCSAGRTRRRSVTACSPR